MPRKDLTEERTHQILDAFERCILKFGLESSSLEKVADEAGVKRPIIRHYVGNRNDLIVALANRLIDQSRVETEGLIDSLGGENRIDQLIDLLFSEQDGIVHSGETVAIFENLVLAGAKLEPVRVLLSNWTTEFIEVIENELRNNFPNAKGHAEVAYGIVSIYYNEVSLLPLRLKAVELRLGKKAADRLVEGLK